MKLYDLFLIGLCLWMSGCSAGSTNGDPIAKAAISGASSVTFSGAVNRTTRYGIEPNTGAYCARYKDGTTGILLTEQGENRNNSGWMKDGVSFSFFKSARPQDVRVIDGSTTSMFAVVKEFETGGTFNLRTACSMNASQREGSKLSISFACNDLRHSNGNSLSVSGWIECTLVEQNY